MSLGIEYNNYDNINDERNKNNTKRSIKSDKKL